MALNKLVMVVDDEPDILSTAKQILDVFGYSCVLVQDADKVLEAARKAKPLLILQDVIMPGLNVDKLMRELKADPALKGTPVLLFSASVNVRETAKRVGAEGFILKPFDLKQLKELLDKYARAETTG